MDAPTWVRRARRTDLDPAHGRPDSTTDELTDVLEVLEACSTIGGADLLRRAAAARGQDAP